MNRALIVLIVLFPLNCVGCGEKAPAGSDNITFEGRMRASLAHSPGWTVTKCGKNDSFYFVRAENKNHEWLIQLSVTTGKTPKVDIKHEGDFTVSGYTITYDDKMVYRMVETKYGDGDRGVGPVKKSQWLVDRTNELLYQMKEAMKP